MELDACTARDGTSLAADVCIIGAGPVGIALGVELEAAGKQVVVLESGGHQPDEELQELNAGETTGDPYQDLRLSRHRGIGGTAAIWNTWFRGDRYAKYVPLDDTDFEPRAWVSWSGWPFDRKTLDPWYRRAHALWGPGPYGFQVSDWNAGEYPRLTWPSGGLTNAIYQYGPAHQFTRTLPTRLAESNSAVLIQGATVTELVRNSGSERIRAARWTTSSGSTGTVEARYFVLAAGGIENPRVLLLLLGERPWLGRGFMEHPVDSSIWLSSRNPALLAPEGGFYFHRATESGRPVLGRIGLSAELLRSEKLPNASLRLLVDAEPQILQASGPRAAARRLVPFQPLRRLAGGAIRGLAGLTRQFRPARYQALLDLEQEPHPENRVHLSTRRDRFGRPLAVLHWRFREKDRANHQRVRSIVVRELERAGAGKVVIVPDQPIDPKHHHHAGTTRMHSDPALGVVDEHLRVHGIENLYVSGSSVFPTAGFANPTLTAIALALRLADHLTDR